MQPKTTYFPLLTHLKTQAGSLDLSTPKVMGILNITPDSFFDGGKYFSVQAAVDHAGKMLDEGAHLLDIGGMSSRPGAAIITQDEEQDRILPVIKAIVQAFPQIPISVDTIHAETARTAWEAGASIINDISGARYDPDMSATVVDLQTPVVIMHMQGLPADMQTDPTYSDVVEEVFDFLYERCRILSQEGLTQLIADPGFGFGKTLTQNYQLISVIPKLKALQLPVLVGISRKSMVNKVLKISAKEALNGTTALHMLLLQAGSDILRVHDVQAAREAIAIFNAAQKMTHLDD